MAGEGAHPRAEVHAESGDDRGRIAGPDGWFMILIPAISEPSYLTD